MHSFKGLGKSVSQLEEIMAEDYPDAEKLLESDLDDLLVKTSKQFNSEYRKSLGANFFDDDLLAESLKELEALMIELEEMAELGLQEVQSEQANKKEPSIEQIIDAKSISKSKVHILTSEGGSGHKEAMNDSKEEYLKKGYDVSVEFVMPAVDAKESSWMKLFGIDVGKKGVRDWNTAQQQGNMKKIKKLVALQWLSELIFGGQFHNKTFNYLALAKEAPELVIDTQAQSSHKIVRAVSNFNKIRNNKEQNTLYNLLVRFNNILRLFPSLQLFASNKYKNEIPFQPEAKAIKIRKRMTDLPNRADHFFRSLKKIKDRDMDCLELEVPHGPGISKHDTDLNLAYYKEKCPNLFKKNGTPKCEFIFTDGPIKKPFKDIMAAKENGTVEDIAPKKSNMTIKLKAANEREVSRIELASGSEALNRKGDNPEATQYFDFTIEAHAKVKSIMLGSQASKVATLAYVDAEIQNYNPPESQVVFVFCGKNDGESSLFSELYNKIEQLKYKNLMPPNLKIVPLTYQDGDMIAKAYARSESVILRSGGISCMEIEATSTGKVFFHAEKDGPFFSETELKDSMLFWEAGNIEHVQATLGKEKVHVVNPEMYNELLSRPDLPIINQLLKNPEAIEDELEKEQKKSIEPVGAATHLYQQAQHDYRSQVTKPFRERIKAALIEFSLDKDLLKLNVALVIIGQSLPKSEKGMSLEALCNRMIEELESAVKASKKTKYDV